MKISTKGRYALRLMIDLAQNNTGEYVSLKAISQRQNISVKYLEQIVTQLSKIGFLKSVRGPQGGYKLTRKPSEYTVGDILRITEGSLAPVACLDDTPNQCERYAQCPTISIWEGLYKIINEYVDSITLQQIIDDFEDKGKWDFCI